MTEETEEPGQWIIALEHTPIRHFSTFCDPELLPLSLSLTLSYSLSLSYSTAYSRSLSLTLAYS